MMWSVCHFMAVFAFLIFGVGCQRPVRTEVRAYITNYESDDVSVIRVSDDTVIATIGVGDQPYGVAASPDGRRVYVANAGSKTLSVINTAENRVVATVLLKKPPIGVTVSPDNRYVYVAEMLPFKEQEGYLEVIRAADNKVEASLDLPTLPEGIVPSADGKRLYVSHRGGLLSAVDAESLTVLQTANLTQYTRGQTRMLQGIVPSADGKQLYVVNNWPFVLSVIREEDLNELAQVKFDNGPFAIALLPQNNKAYVSIEGNLRLSDQVAVVDTSQNAIVSTITVGLMPMGIDVTPDAKKVYVASRKANLVFVIDPSQDQVVGSIGVGKEPVAFGKFICTVPLSSS